MTIRSLTTKCQVYSTIYEYWINTANNKKYITEDTYTSFLDGGYYYLDIDGIRYASINSLYYSTVMHTQIDSQAANNQLVWLESLLLDAKAKSKKVILLYHIPLGKFLTPSGNANFWNDTYSQQFTRIIQSYSNDIIITINGHTHIEDLRVNNAGIAFSPYRGAFYNNNIVVRGVSPNLENNPGFSILDVQNMIPSSLTSYTFDIVKSINATSADAYWSKLYESNKDLQMTNLTVAGISDLQSRASKSITLFLKYIAYKLG